MGRRRNAGRAWRATSYGDKSTTPLELRGYGDDAMSPRLRRAPSRSSFQAEVAERGAKPLLQFRRVVGGIHGLSLSLSFSAQPSGGRQIFLGEGMASDSRGTEGTVGGAEEGIGGGALWRQVLCLSTSSPSTNVAINRTHTVTPTIFPHRPSRPLLLATGQSHLAMRTAARHLAPPFDSVSRAAVHHTAPCAAGTPCARKKERERDTR